MKIKSLSMKLSQKNSIFFSGLLVLPKCTRFVSCVMCCNPSLGLTTKAKACKGAGQEWARESHFMFLGVQESVREWTSTLPNELPLWELESQWTFESLEGNCRGQNSLDWKFPYIIENLLERRCLKWARMTHLGT
jgi:hypothetical protein